jgi:hypothetical protein
MGLPTLEGLLRITERKPLGPFPTFDKAHLLLAFITIGLRGNVGRHSLAAGSGLGEGAVRTVIKRLKDEGYVSIGAAGCHLTPGGKRVYSVLAERLSQVVPVPSSNLTVGAYQVAVEVRKGGSAVTGGIEQRDSAIKVGAAGATTYVIREDKFTVPGGSSDCERDFPGEIWRKLRTELGPKEGDSVILCGASTPTLATLGAVAVAITLL